MPPPDNSPLDQAIAQLQVYRAALGDTAVEAAIAALRRHAGAAPDGPPAPSPAPRLRQVSVLFADVADSTAMLGRVGTEDAMDLLGRALQLFADAVTHWGGQVLRYTGDGIKAVFGMQGLREDEAERAVQAGLRILDDAARHADHVRREFGVPDFGVRVGIHTGPVLLGGGPEAERAAMGHAVHLAARLEQTAPRGRLRVSDATWAQVRGLFVAEAQPPLFVKGHQEALRTWLVRGPASGPEPSVQRGIEGIDTPTIGREAELARLLALHARCVAGRRFALATVIAEAGVGKTRLRQELLRRLGLAEGDEGLLQARAHPSSALQPYGLLRRLLARWLSIRDDLSAADARQRLVDGLSPWLGDSAAQQAPRLGALIGLDFSQHPAVQALRAQALREQGFAALRAALFARAAAAPLLLVLDDLHWADSDSLDFVQSLLPSAAAPAGQPLMLLLLARPSLPGERGFSLEPAPGVDTEALQLQPLAAEQGRALLQALLQPLPDAPEALQKLLLERAQGNPLFLEALLRMLIDDGVIDTRSRPWRLRQQRLDSLQVPPTLLAVLQARLDALPAGDLRALQGASIVGPVFWDAALAALDPQAPAALPQLQQRNLAAERPASAFANTSERAFVHALLHEATYGTVLKAQRREGHALVARWLGARIGERANEFLAITADHCERAGDSAQALEFWDRAQIDAFRRYANEAALSFNERALAQPALTDPRWRHTLLVNRHELLERLGRSDEAERVDAQMQAWAEANDDNAIRADRLAARMLAADHQGRQDEAQQLARQALALAGQADDSAAAAAALAHGELAWLATLRHDHDTVAREVEAGLQQAGRAARVERRRMGYDGYQHQLRAIAIEALLQQERYVDTLAAIEQGLAGIDDRAQDRYNLLSRRAPAERQLGRIEESAGTARQVLALAEACGMPRLRQYGLVLVAEAALWAGDLDAAEARLAEAALLAEAASGGFDRPLVLALQGDLARRRGLAEGARTAWLAARTLYLAQDRRAKAIEVGCELARLDLAAGAADLARAAVDEALAEAAKDPRPQRRALPPAALLVCHEVLAAGGDARAAALRGDLLARLDEQLAALPQAAAREQLLRGVPHWQAVQALQALRALR